MRSNRRRPVHLSRRRSRSRSRSRSRRLSQSRNMRRSSSRKKMSRRGRTNMRMRSPRRRRSRSRQAGGASSGVWGKMRTAAKLAIPGTQKADAAELNQLNKLVTKIYKILSRESRSDSEPKKEAAEKMSKALLTHYCMVSNRRGTEGETQVVEGTPTVFFSPLSEFTDVGVFGKTRINYLARQLMPPYGVLNDDIWGKAASSEKETAVVFCQLLIELYLLDRSEQDQKNLLDQFQKKLIAGALEEREQQYKGAVDSFLPNVISNVASQALASSDMARVVDAVKDGLNNKLNDMIAALGEVPQSTESRAKRSGPTLRYSLPPHWVEKALKTDDGIVTHYFNTKTGVTKVDRPSGAAWRRRNYQAERASRPGVVPPPARKASELEAAPHTSLGEAATVAQAAKRRPQTLMP